MKRWILLATLAGLVLALTLVGCSTGKAALGTKDNPLIMSFVPSGDTQAITVSGETLAKLLSEKTGLTVESNVATSYTAVVEAMGTGKAHIGWLPPFGYVQAHEKYGAEIGLITIRFGNFFYKGQIIVGADSGIKTLDDLKGKTMCWVDVASPAGFIFPKAMLISKGYDVENMFTHTTEAGSNNNVVLAVYNGDCDAGATYVDARGAVEKDYPDVRDKVSVIAETDKIPNDTVTFAKDLPAEMQDQVRKALLDIAGTDQGKEALKNLYSIEGLTEAPGGDAFFDPVRQAAQLLDIKLQ